MIDSRRRKQLRERLTAVTVSVLVVVPSALLVVRVFRDVKPPQSPRSSSPSVQLEPRFTASIDIGPIGQTNAIVAAAGSVWITAYSVDAGDGTLRDFLYRLDPTTDQVEASIEVEGAPSWETGGEGMTFAFGSIWIVGASRQDGEPQAILTRVDPSTNQVTATIGLGGEWGADVSSTGDAIWVATFADPVAQVLRVDPATNLVTDTIDLGSDYVRRLEAVDDAVIAEEMIWPSDNEGPCGILTSIDPLTRQVRARESVSSTCGGGDLIAWQGQIWLSNDRFAPVDPQTSRPAETGLAYADPQFPRGFVVPDETGIWYAAYPGGNGSRPDVLTRLDASTGRIVPYLEIPEGPIAGVVLDGVLWVLNFEGSVTRIDLLASAEAQTEPGTISLPADAIPEGALLIQTGTDAEIIRSGDVMSHAVSGLSAPLDLSPDGSTVLGSTAAGLAAVDVGSGEIRFLVGGVEGRVFGSARWSPDGSMVAYTEGADDPAGGSTLCVLTVTSLEQTCFAELPRVYSFDWAPNGKQMVVAGPPANPLTIVNVSTGTTIDITPQVGDTAINHAIGEAGMGTSFQLVDPTWSPSGSYLATLANLQDSEFAYVPVVFTPDGRFVAFGRPSGEYPEPMEWSPTSDVLAYTRGEPPYRITEAYLLDPATGEEDVLVSGKGSDPFVLLDMVWSPSGRWLAIAAWEAVDEGPQTSLVMLDALDPTSLRRFPLDTAGTSRFLVGWEP